MKFAIYAALLLLPSLASAENWPRFRGPNGQGLADSRVVLPQENSVLWKQPLPGEGHGSPVVWEDRLFVMTALPENGTQIVCCLDTKDGKLIWERSFPARTYRKKNLNTFASATPAVDDTLVYCTWANPDEFIVAALDQADGKTVWKKDLGPFIAEHGYGGSPILVGDSVIVAAEQDEPGFVAALDRKSGEFRWKTPRKGEKTAYATPCLFRPKSGQEQLISASQAHGLYALDATTGKPTWELPLFKMRVCGSPLVTKEFAMASCGSGGGGKRTIVVRPGDPAKGTEASVAYEPETARPYVVTPIAVGDLLFLWTDNGILTCLDLATGKTHYRERLQDTFFASPISDGRTLYCISRTGKLFVIPVSKEFKKPRKIDLEEPSHATAAIVDGVLYVRTLSNMFALGKGR